MRKLKTLLLAMLLPVCALASGWDDNEYKQIEASVQQPQIGTKRYPVTDYGAKTTATAAQNQKAINKAISAASSKGGGQVIIPAGTWKREPSRCEAR